MITVNEYIKLILKKKKWTNVKLCQELNKIEEKLGDSRTTKQNITNYLNNYHEIGIKWLIKVEKALDLSQGTLINMINMPCSKKTQKKMKEFIKKVNAVTK